MNAAGRRPTPDETQEIYTLYCQLVTIVHDYAIGKQLYKNRCYSWAITANYYSLMHCGRFICHLGLKDYPQNHAKLHKFLSGNISHKERTLDDLMDEIQGFSNLQEIRSKIVSLGEKLKKVKKLREDNSYEFFIVSHQINHTVLNAEFDRVHREIERLNDEHLEFVLCLFADYIISREYASYFTAFLKDRNPNFIWAFQNLYGELGSQQIGSEIIQDIKDIINHNLMDRLQSLGEIELDDGFFDPIKYDAFTNKNNKMKEFVTKVKDLVGAPQ